MIDLKMVGAAGIEPATPTMSTGGPGAISLFHNDPASTQSASVAPAFTAECAKHAPTTPCIEWTGRKTKAGYGYTSRPGGIAYAHREAWEKANGRPVPDGMNVCHACDNPGCINPEHLWLGTQLDNMRDCKAKGRPHGRPYRFGEEDMRRMAETPGADEAVGKHYGVGRDSIYRWRKRFGIGL